MSTREFTEDELEYAEPEIARPLPWKPHQELIAAARAYGVSCEDILGRSRSKTIARARHALWRALRAHGWSYPEIARYTGHDHSSVMYGCSAENRSKRHEAYKDRLARAQP